jgi:hypothetical protein
MLLNPPPHVFFVDRLQPAARDEALHSIEQFQPILQWRFGYGLPLIESLLTLEENPLASDALSIDLQLVAFFGNAFPTDFGLGHLNRKSEA